MDKNLRNKIGEINPYDGLLADTNPSPIIQAGTLRKATGQPVTYLRGTVLAKATGASGDNKLVPLGTEKGAEAKLEADCILCDDITVGTGADETVPVYVAGCFNIHKLITIGEHAIDEADKDALRAKGIYLKACRD